MKHSVIPSLQPVNHYSHMEAKSLPVLKCQCATVDTEDFLHNRKQWLAWRLAQIDPEYRDGWLCAGLLFRAES